MMQYDIDITLSVSSVIYIRTLSSPASGTLELKLLCFMCTSSRAETCDVYNVNTCIHV